MGISGEMAYRLSKFLNTSAEMWMNLQRDYELYRLSKKRRPKIKPLQLSANIVDAKKNQSTFGVSQDTCTELHV